MPGVKQTKEIVTLVAEAVIAVYPALKDGAQGEDITTILGNLSEGGFMQKLAEARDGMGEVASEVQALKVDEGLELAEHAIAQTRRIIAAVEAEEVVPDP